MDTRYSLSHSCLHRLAPLLFLASLGVFASLVNAGSGPPRTLFAKFAAEEPVPSVAVSAVMDDDGRWVLAIEATGFRFTHLCTLTAEPVPVGHAHVYSGDRKLASAFYPVIDIGQLPPGRHEVRVVLRGQDHRALIGPLGLVEARTLIDVPDA